MSRKKKNTLLFAAALALAVTVAIGLPLWLVLGRTAENETGRETRIAADGYASSDFYMQDGFLRYGAGEHMAGIDVSVHQGLIDWQAVADSGVEFAVIRAGLRGATLGALYEDEQFRYNLREAKAAGLKVGVYFFSQAKDEAEAREEAEYVCKLLDGEKLELPVYYDWEVVDESSRVTSPSDVDLTACTLAFCENVEANGYRAGVYFNQTIGYLHLDLEKTAQYSLWLAEYSDAPTFPAKFRCLQFSDSGTVAGIVGNVDLDLWISEETNEVTVNEIESESE